MINNDKRERADNGQCDLVRVERLQMIGLMVVMLTSYVDVTCDECDFGPLASWSYSKEWIWNLGTKTVLK